MGQESRQGLAGFFVQGLQGCNEGIDTARGGISWDLVSSSKFKRFLTEFISLQLQAHGGLLLQGQIASGF